jgi:hypothetical protein
MPSTYTPIYTTTLGSDQSSVSLSSFGGYTDLVLIMQASTTHGDSGARGYVQFNNETSLYSDTFIRGNGSVAGSGRDTSDTYLAWAVLGNSSSGFGTHILNIQNYTNTSTYKTTLSRSSGVNSDTLRAYVGLYRNTNAITTMILRADSNIRSGSTISLYGIKAA